MLVLGKEGGWGYSIYVIIYLGIGMDGWVGMGMWMGDSGMVWVLGERNEGGR
jgi:hypothetical protein